jgi:hypothetical protein
VKVQLIYRGDGFEATKIVNMPGFLYPGKGITLGIVLDDGAGQPGTEWFPLHSASFHLNQNLFILKLATPLKYDRYKKSSTPKLGERDFSNEGWEIRKNTEIKPFE